MKAPTLDQMAAWHVYTAKPLPTAEQQIVNLFEAYRVMRAVPARQVALMYERYNDRKKFDVNTVFKVDDDTMHNDCKSVGCIAGWLSAQPHFQAQGLYWNGVCVCMHNVPEPGAFHSYYGHYGRTLFGREGELMFAGGGTGMRGKREALARIRIALRLRGAIGTLRNAGMAALELAMPW